MASTSVHNHLHAIELLTVLTICVFGIFAAEQDKCRDTDHQSNFPTDWVVGSKVVPGLLTSKTALANTMGKQRVHLSGSVVAKEFLSPNGLACVTVPADGKCRVQLHPKKLTKDAITRFKYVHHMIYESS
jgi:hypothetical protein